MFIQGGLNNFISAKAFFLCHDGLDLFIDDWQVIWVVCFFLDKKIRHVKRTQNKFDSHEQAHKSDTHAALLT